MMVIFFSDMSLASQRDSLKMCQCARLRRKELYNDYIKKSKLFGWAPGILHDHLFMVILVDEAPASLET